MTFKVVGAPIYTRILKLIIHYLKKRDLVHKELLVSFTEEYSNTLFIALRKEVKYTKNYQCHLQNTNIFKKKKSTFYL